MLTSRWGEGPVWLKNRPERNYNKRVSGVKVWEAKALVHQPVVLQPHHLSFALVNQLPALSPSNKCKSKNNKKKQFCSSFVLACLFQPHQPWPSLPTILKYIHSNSSCTSGFKEVVSALANVYNVRYFIWGRMTKTNTSISCSTKTWLLPHQCTPLLTEVSPEIDWDRRSYVTVTKGWCHE